MNSADKDIVDNLRIRREVLPSMWDVFEKTIEKLKSGKYESQIKPYYYLLSKEF